MNAVLYVDADRFFFSVEAAERPELANDPRPIVIAHDPRQAPRSVVTTANNAARALGINSGMSAAIALHRGPNLVFLPPRHDLYGDYSARLMALLRTESPLVQQNSVDEAACEWTHRGFDRPPAAALRNRVKRELGLSVSLGLASNPLVAKMATETAKQNQGVHVVPPGMESSFLAPMPVRALVGVGPKAELRLRAVGLETIGQIAMLPLHELVARFGASYGRYLYRASRGEDDSTLSDERTYKSISAERTFGADTADRAELWRELRGQAAEVAARLENEGMLAGEVAIKLRYGNWDTVTRQMKLGVPTADAEALATGAAALMRKHWDRRAVRLLGVRASKLTSEGAAIQPALLEV